MSATAAILASLDAITAETNNHLVALDGAFILTECQPLT